MRRSLYFATVALALASAAVMTAGTGPLSFASLVSTAEASPSIAQIAQVTDATFDAEIRQSATPVVIDLYADWCGPCRMFAPTFDATASEYAGKVKFARVDVDANRPTARLFSIRVVPTIVIVSKDAAGNLVYHRIEGAISQAQLKAFIDDATSGKTPGTALPAQ